MSHGESTLTKINRPRLWERTCRKAFLTLMTRFPEGHMVIRENGEEVARGGNPASDLKAEVNILHMEAYPALLLGGSVAAGETYMKGLWSSPDLTAVIRMFARNLTTLDEWENRFKWLTMPVSRIQHWLRSNTQQQAKKNIEAHYDLGNRLYSRFLDQSMMYSSAIYPDPHSSLGEAQENKLRTICDKLRLNTNDHLLEIGTGWGGLAVFAAKHYGCRVTTTTISEEQFSYANEWVQREQLDDRVTVLKKDYRLLTGQYTKLVSIEMIEAVGFKYLGEFFSRCQRLLKPDGCMLLQSITIDDRRFDGYARSVDFIQKYIFPGGFLPSQYQLNAHLKKHSDFMIRDLHDIGLDYARTLDDWYQAFISAKEALLQDGYDEQFMRMWTYYLKYCEGGFLERTISTVQLLLTRPKHVSDLARG